MSFSSDAVVRPRELHHVTFKTNDIGRMVDFYALLTGHEVTYQGDIFAAITFDDANHRIALMAIAPWEEIPQEQLERSVGLHHAAYEYDSLDQLMQTYSRVKEAGVEPEWTVNHGPTLSFYYRDPDGHGIELQVDNCDHDLERWMAIIEGPFQQNQAGINVDPEKIIAALDRGVSAAEILRDSYKNSDNPYAAPGYGPPGLNLQPPPGLKLPEVS